MDFTEETEHLIINKTPIRLLTIYTKRYGLQRNIETTPTTPTQNTVTGYTDLRSLGRSVNFSLRGLSIQKKELSEAISDRRQLERSLKEKYSSKQQQLKERGLLNTAKGQAELQKLQSRQDAQRAKAEMIITREQQRYNERLKIYQEQYGSYTDETLSAAQRAAPKKYHTGNVRVASFSESRLESQRQASDKALIASVEQTPGIIKPGQIKSQYYQAKGYGGIISTSVQSKPSETKEVFAIDLFDAQNREAIRERAANPSFSNVGLIWGSAQATYIPEVQESKREIQGEESARYKAVERTSVAVTKYQQGFEERQKKLDKTLSFFSFGKGKPYEKRSFWGKTAQTGFSILSAPVWGPAALADTSYLAAQKSFLYTGALMTPETKEAALSELKSNTGVFKKVYTDPQTYAYAFAGGATKGYFDYNVAKSTPSSITVKPYSLVAEKPVIKPGSISTIGTMKSTATVQYKYGPFKMFKRTETVPVQGSFIFSGTTLASTRTPRIIGTTDTVASITLSNTKRVIVLGKNLKPRIEKYTAYRTFYNTKTYDSIYRPRSGALTLLSQDTKTAVFTQPGRGVTPSPFSGIDSDLVTSPVRSFTFAKNKYGVFVAKEKTSARGFSYPLTYQYRRVVGRTPIYQGFMDINKRITAQFALVGKTARINKGSRAFVSETERALITEPSGGANFRIARAGFNDLESTYILPNENKINLRIIGRRGTVGGRTKSRTGTITTERPRPFNDLTYKPPSFAGLAAPEFKRYKAYAPVYILRLNPQSTTPQASKDQRLNAIPILKPSVMTQSKLRTDIIPRQTTTLRLTTTQKLLRPQGPTPSFRTTTVTPAPRIPIIPPPLFLPSGGFTAKKNKSPFDTQRKKYTPSLYAIGTNFKGKAPKKSLLGFAIRPIR